MSFPVGCTVPSAMSEAGFFDQRSVTLRPSALFETAMTSTVTVPWSVTPVPAAPVVRRTYET